MDRNEIKQKICGNLEGEVHEAVSLEVDSVLDTLEDEVTDIIELLRITDVSNLSDISKAFEACEKLAKDLY